jgi:hypothetical protein
VRTHFGDATAIVAVDTIAAPGRLSADLAAPGPLRGVGGPFDLIVAAHLLNELFAELPREPRVAARVRKILGWCESLLAEDGTFIVIEPALRETSRDLLAARDQLIAAGLQVIAPCFWTGPCPALARDRDWCHDTATRASDDPSAPARVDFSYLVLRRHAVPVADPTLFRIVSDSLVEKGRLRLFGCGPAGRHPLVRLDRHRTAANRAFGDLLRGDVAQISGAATAGDGLRVTDLATVARVGRSHVS